MKTINIIKILGIIGLLFLLPSISNAQIQRVWNIAEYTSTMLPPPATGAKVAYRTLNNSLFYWDGTQWKRIAGPGIVDTSYSLSFSSPTLSLLGSGSSVSLTNLYTAGYGLIKTGEAWRADTSAPSGLATRIYARTLPTLITSGQVAYSNGSTLVGSPNHFWDNTNARLGIGTTTPSYELNIIKGISGEAGIAIQNTNASGRGTLVAINNLGHGISLIKYGNSASSYKTFAANTAGIYNAGLGKMSFLNDASSSVIDFATGGSSVAHMTLASTGNLLIGTTTDVATSILTARSTTKSSSPFPFHTTAESNAITGVNGNFEYITDGLGPALSWYNGTRKAYGLESTFARGTATRVPFFDANGQIADDASLFHNTSTGVLQVFKSFNGSTGFYSKNQSSGGSAIPAYVAENDVAKLMSFGISSSGYTAAPYIGANTAFFYTDANNGFALTVNSNSNIRFAIGGISSSNEVLKLSSTGNDIDANRNKNAPLIFRMNNANAGSSAYSAINLIASSTSTRSFSIAKAGENTPAVRSISPGDSYLQSSYGDLLLFADNSGGKIKFATNAASTPQMTLTSSGFLAVGNTSPTEMIHSADDIRVGDSLRVGTLPNQTSATKILSADGSGWVGYRNFSDFASSNIYTADGSLTANRTLHGAGYTLRFNANTIVRDSLKVANLADHASPDSIVTTKGGWLGKKKFLMPAANAYSVGNSGFFFDAALAGHQISGNTYYHLDYADTSGYWEKGTYGRGWTGVYGNTSTGFSELFATDADGGGSFTVDANNGIVYRFKVSIPAAFSVDTLGTMRVQKYGAGTKEAADLSKTQSNYIAGFATDGTVLDYNLDSIPSIYNKLPNESVTIDANANSLVINNLTDFELSSETGNGSLLFNDETFQVEANTSINLSTNEDAVLELTNEVELHAPNLEGVNRMRIDSFGFHSTFTNTLSDPDSAMSMITSYDRGLLKLHKYGKDNHVAAVTGEYSTRVAGLTSNGVVQDFRLARDTFIEDVTLFSVGTLMHDCQELTIISSMTNLAPTNMEIRFPDASDLYRGRKIIVYSKKKDVGIYIPQIKVVGGVSRLYFTTNPAVGGTDPSDQSTLSIDDSTWSDHGTTFEFTCLRIDNTPSYRWVLKQR